MNRDDDFPLAILGMCVLSFMFMLTAMLAIVSNTYIMVEGTYKPECSNIKISCNANTILYTSYNHKPICEGEVIQVDKRVKRGVYYETFYLNAGTTIDTTHKVFTKYEFKKWLNYKRSKVTDSIECDGYYVIVSEVPYMKYTIRKTSYCKDKVEYVCGDKSSEWIPIGDNHYIETDGIEYLKC